MLCVPTSVVHEISRHALCLMRNCTWQAEGGIRSRWSFTANALIIMSCGGGTFLPHVSLLKMFGAPFFVSADRKVAGVVVVVVVLVLPSAVDRFPLLLLLLLLLVAHRHALLKAPVGFHKGS